MNASVGGHDPSLDRIAATLAEHGVRFVAVGAWALDVQDYDIGYRTEDIDMAVQNTADNFERLSAALKCLNATLRVSDHDNVPFDHSGASLRQKRLWNLTCQHGHFDVATEYDPGLTYDDFSVGAHPVTIVVDNAPVVIHAADVHDIMRSKEAAGRDKDRRVLDLLHEQLEESSTHSH